MKRVAGEEEDFREIPDDVWQEILVRYYTKIPKDYSSPFMMGNFNFRENMSVMFVSKHFKRIVKKSLPELVINKYFVSLGTSYPSLERIYFCLHAKQVHLPFMLHLRELVIFGSKEEYDLRYLNSRSFPNLTSLRFIESTSLYQSEILISKEFASQIRKMKFDRTPIISMMTNFHNLEVLSCSKLREPVKEGTTLKRIKILGVGPLRDIGLLLQHYTGKLSCKGKEFSIENGFLTEIPGEEKLVKMIPLTNTMLNLLTKK